MRAGDQGGQRRTVTSRAAGRDPEQLALQAGAAPHPGVQNDLLNQAAAACAREQDDRNLARKLLAAASGVSMPKDGNVGRALSKIAGGPLTPGTILALKQDAAQAQRQYEHESTLDRFANNIVDEAGGATNLVTFGNVGFGDPSTLAYKAGEA